MAEKHKVIGVRQDGRLDLYLDGNKLDPAKSQKVWNHSPDGFNAGYGGSGPAQSALAILLEITDEQGAVLEHQTFKWEYLAKHEYLNAPRFEFEFVWGV